VFCLDTIGFLTYLMDKLGSYWLQQDDAADSIYVETMQCLWQHPLWHARILLLQRQPGTEARWWSKQRFLGRSFAGFQIWSLTKLFEDCIKNFDKDDDAGNDEAYVTDDDDDY
jgi:hypothetical protein